MGNIKKNDEVQLKSGGPKMTVQDVGDFEFEYGIENGAKCRWFDKEGKSMEEVFDVENLVKVEGPPIGIVRPKKPLR